MQDTIEVLGGKKAGTLTESFYLYVLNCTLKMNIIF